MIEGLLMVLIGHVCGLRADLTDRPGYRAVSILWVLAGSALIVGPLAIPFIEGFMK